MKRSLSQKGFAVVESILIAVIVLLLAGVGYYVWHVQKQTSATLDAASKVAQSSPQKVNKKAITPDPTANWTSYTSSTGKFSLKYPHTWVSATHPELCADGILLLGANSDSVGKCASEDFGQIAITWQQQKAECGDLDSDSWTQISKESVTVSSVTGIKQTASAKQPGSGLGSLPIGTKTVQYCFTAKGTTYIADYTQLSTYPDALADFNTMVTKTLKFE